MAVKFSYSLVRRGKALYFRIKEQSPELYNDELLTEINSYLTSLNLHHHLESCGCPELSGSTIFIRGRNGYEDEISAQTTWSSVEKAVLKQQWYIKSLDTVIDFLAHYQDNAVMRKITLLESRFKKGSLPKTKSKCLPFPKDHHAFF